MGPPCIVNFRVGFNLDSKKAFIIHFDVFFIANPICTPVDAINVYIYFCKQVNFKIIGCLRD